MDHIVTDSNYRDFLRPQYQLRPREIPLGQLPYARPYCDADFPLVPEVEWPERIAEMTAKKLWPQDIYDAVKKRHKYQNGLPYCWAYSGAQAAEMTMAVQGRDYVELAPESIGGAVGWRNSGGYIEEAIVYWAENGMATRAFCPDHVINPSRFKDGWEEDRKKCLVLEGIDFGYGDKEKNWHYAVSLLLDAKMVPWTGLNWWRHAVTFGKLVIENGEVCPYTENTHLEDDFRILSGSRKYPDSLVAIRELTWRSAA